MKHQAQVHFAVTNRTELRWGRQAADQFSGGRATRVAQRRNVRQRSYTMNLILKGLAGLAVGLVIAGSAEAGDRRGRPAPPPTDYYYYEGQSGPGYYGGQQPIPAARMRNGTVRDRTAYGPSVPTYGWG